MPKNSRSFQPGRSGNPKGRPKGVRTLARLIDVMGDEQCAGTEEDFRTVAVRQLWEATATGTLNLGESSQKLKPEEWIRLVQWLVGHVDKVAVEQWTWQGQSQLHAEMEEEAGEYEIEAADGIEEDVPSQGLMGDYDEERLASGAEVGRLLAETVFS